MAERCYSKSGERKKVTGYEEEVNAVVRRLPCIAYFLDTERYSNRDNHHERTNITSDYQRRTQMHTAVCVQANEILAYDSRAVGYVGGISRML